MSVVRGNTLRNPEYTGENRCIPCTIVNTVIALVVAGGIALVYWPLAIPALLVFLGVIYFRGFLVPGTPTLTQQYLPESVLQVFGKEEVDAGVAEYADLDLEDHLIDAGVVEMCVDQDDLCLTEAFEREWWASIEDLNDDDQAAIAVLAEILDESPEPLAINDDRERFGVTYDGDVIATWHSKAMFIADLSVRPLLEEYLDTWSHLDDRERTGLIAGMRAFLEACPVCETPLEPVEDVRTSCCGRSRTSVSVECEACEATVFSGTYT